MNEIDVILNDARNSISSYCINTCKAKCCKKGQLFLFSKEEVSAVTKNNTQKYIDSNNIKKNDFGNFYFDLETNGGCPNLNIKTSMCNIHKNINKPKICSDFPLFKAKEYIVSAGTCPAVQNKMFENHFRKIEELGYKVI